MLKASFGSSRSTARLLGPTYGVVEAAGWFYAYLTDAPLSQKLQPAARAHAGRQFSIVHPEDGRRKSKRPPARTPVAIGDSEDWDWLYCVSALKLTTMVFSTSMGTPLRRKGS